MTMSSYVIICQSLMPEFEFNFKIKNETGRIDSIILGYDKRADAMIDLLFDEKENV